MSATAQRTLTRESVIYQIYPRSFADSNGDGIGDLAGATARLEHIADLGCDGIWLSPFFRSPQADMGYDVSDYCDVAPEYGDVTAAERLITRAHELGLAVLFDMVPCHTSIEHPWFRDHPDWYIIRDVEERPNNWASVFGGPAWDRDPHGRGWYLHTFYPEQPNLNWRNPELVEAMHGAMRFWFDRGLDGFRVDAIPMLFVDEQLRDNPPSTEKPFLLTHPDWAALEARHNTHQAEIFDALAGIRAAFPDKYFVAEAGAPRPVLERYTEHFDTAFCFALIGADHDAAEIGQVINEFASMPGIAWMLANHDLPRLASRWGAELSHALALLQLTLPGSAFIYQGDEIGMIDGAGHPEVTHDRFGRDGFRHPMQWSAQGDFSTGTPWLPLVNPRACNVADQADDPDSVLGLYRRLLSARRSISGPVTGMSASGHLLRFSRGGHHVAVNLGRDPIRTDIPGDLVIATHEPYEPGCLPGHAAVLTRD